MQPSRIALVTPVFNDWDAFSILLKDLAAFSIEQKLKITVFAVDDCSTLKNYPKKLDINLYRNIETYIIRLGCNLENQKALVIGIAEAFRNKDFEGVLVMDSDGEDKVEDIQTLISYKPNNPIALARRSSRSEGLKFKLFYGLYKNLFKLLIGKIIDFGNFCYIPRERLEALVYNPNIWNNLAATIVKSNIPTYKIGISKGLRYCGKTKMNFTKLVVHGLGAMSVFIDFIFTRILSLLSIFIIFLILISFIVLGLKLFTGLTIPGWTTTVLLGVNLAILQAIIIIMILAFMVLSYRSSKLFIPAKDAYDFIVKKIKIIKE